MNDKSTIKQSELIDLLSQFYESSFKNENNSVELFNEWNSFKDLLNSNTLDYEKIFHHINDIHYGMNTKAINDKYIFRD